MHHQSDPCRTLLVLCTTHKRLAQAPTHNPTDQTSSLQSRLSGPKKHCTCSLWPALLAGSSPGAGEWANGALGADGLAPLQSLRATERLELSGFDDSVPALSRTSGPSRTT